MARDSKHGTGTIPQHVNSVVAPTGLQTEWCTNPVGLDEPRPRLRWIVAAEPWQTDVRQFGYHVIVETSGASATPDTVWDSGLVESNNSTVVEYSGEALCSNTIYTWRVKTYQAHDRASLWSDSAYFITGMLSQEEWDDAAWLKHPTAAEDKQIWYRRIVTLPDAAEGQPAIVSVASVGYHALFINGVRADPERQLAPPVLDYVKRVPYVTYEVSALLTSGPNIIGVWTAAGWAANKGFAMPHTFKLMMVGGFLGADGRTRRMTITTDETWRCGESDTQSTELVTRLGENGGERIDARRSQPEWNRLDLDDKNWLTATTVQVNAPCQSTFRVPKTTIIETYEPTAVRQTSDGWRIEFPTNFTGWVDFTVLDHEAGDTITILTADDNETLCDFNQRSYLVCGGTGLDQFRPRFAYAAGRFITLQGLRKAPEAVKAFALGTDFERTGHFSSSNDLYNRIYETDLWTFRANTPEGFTMDCPHRERMGYGETATGTSWGIGLPNYATGAFYTKIVQDWVDVQDPDGSMPHVAPVPEHDHWGGPMWCSAGLNVAYEHYLTFADLRVLEVVRPSAASWLDYLHRHTRDGLLQAYNGPNHYLGDWLAPDGRRELGDSPQAAFFNNCVYAWNLQEMLLICRALGRAGDAHRYEARLASLQTAMVDEWYDPTTGAFLDGRQVQQAFALLTSLLPVEQSDAVRARLDQEFVSRHFLDMGSAGVSALLRFVVGTSDAGPSLHVAHILNQTSYPGYGYFLARGETTWPEEWNSEVESRIHTCFTGIASWFVKSLAGIRPDAERPGYERILIRPTLVPEVDWAEATVESPYGPIRSRWVRQGHGVSLTVEVPPNAEAAVFFLGERHTVGSGSRTWLLPLG